MTERNLVQTEDQDGITILSFGGAVTTIHEDMLADIANQMLASTFNNPRAILVDLGGVEFFGSSFIEVLFRVWNRVKGKPGGFALCEVSPYCTEILTVTNLHRLWPIHSTRQEAILAMQAEH